MKITVTLDMASDEESLIFIDGVNVSHKVHELKLKMQPPTRSEIKIVAHESDDDSRMDDAALAMMRFWSEPELLE